MKEACVVCSEPDILGGTPFALLAATIVLATTLVGSCAAEGSTELSTGGINFVRDDNLDMLAQSVAISPSEIAVRYRLLNTSERDITRLASFPMPDIHIEGPDESVAVPSDDPVNLLSFSALVNAKPVSPAVEQ